MELLTTKRRQRIRNEGIIHGMMAVRTRIHHLELCKRDAELLATVIDADIEKMRAMMAISK